MCSPSWTPPHLPPHAFPQGHPSAPAPAPCLMHQAWIGDLFHIQWYTCFNAILSDHPTLAFSHRVQKTVLYICVCFAVSHVGSSLPFLKSHPRRAPAAWDLSPLGIKMCWVTGLASGAQVGRWSKPTWERCPLLFLFVFSCDVSIFKVC